MISTSLINISIFGVEARVEVQGYNQESVLWIINEARSTSSGANTTWNKWMNK